MDLFGEIGTALHAETRLYVIGGAVLVRRRLKNATKDIDVIVSTREEFSGIENALKGLGFTAAKLTSRYNKMNLSHILARDDFRIDLFEKVVCSKFHLSKAMAKRAEKVYDKNKLSVFLCSNEDIFLFKTMTEREGDLDDCVALAKTGLDWGAMLDELKTQVRESGNDVWITWIGERLELLEDRGLEIPIIKDVRLLCEELYDRLERKLKR